MTTLLVIFLHTFMICNDLTCNYLMHKNQILNLLLEYFKKKVVQNLEV